MSHREISKLLKLTTEAQFVPGGLDLELVLFTTILTASFLETELFCLNEVGTEYLLASSVSELVLVTADCLAAEGNKLVFTEV